MVETRKWWWKPTVRSSLGKDSYSKKLLREDSLKAESWPTPFAATATTTATATATATVTVVALPALGRPLLDD